VSLYLIGGIWLSDLGNSAYWPLPGILIIRPLTGGQYMQTCHELVWKHT
jgi:glucose dehydrogenase